MCVYANAFFGGCGDSGNKVTAPEKCLPPTKPAGVGTGGGDDSSGGTASAEVK